MFAVAWWWLLQSYRRLNRAKFQVIKPIEPGLPVHLFSEEWAHLQSTKAPPRLWPLGALQAWLRGYHDLGTAERIVPLAFAGIYIVELVRQATA